MALPVPETANDLSSAHLPQPVLFHPLKHHLGYIRSFIQISITSPASGTVEALRRIGQSQFDLYTGSMSPSDIAEGIVLYLQQQDLLQPAAYRRYLTELGNHYRTVTLPGNTDWVLRWGEDPKRYVHLHPARYAANTIRVKATSLKTAIAATIVSHQLDLSIDLPVVNQVRAEWLSLPPLQLLSLSEGTGKLIALLQQP